MPLPFNVVTRVPVEEWIDPDDAGYSVLQCLGVSVLLEPPGRVRESLIWQIEDALKAKAAAEASTCRWRSTPMSGCRCRRCEAPFIDLPTVKMCSDKCRVEAKRALAGPAPSGPSAGPRPAMRGPAACRHCGEQSASVAGRSSVLFGRCRVAAHPGASPGLVSLEVCPIPRAVPRGGIALGRGVDGFLDQGDRPNRSRISAGGMKRRCSFRGSCRPTCSSVPLRVRRAGQNRGFRDLAVSSRR